MTASTPTPACCRQRGYTLVETLTCLTLVSTLAAFAVPGFAGLLQSQRLAAARGELHAALLTARSEALDRGLRVALCPSSDGLACRGDSRWEHGWMMFVDADSNRTRGSTEPVLLVGDPAERVRIASNEGRRVVIYHADGSAAGFNVTFSLCSATAGADTLAQTLVVSNAGRVRSGTGAPCGA